MPFGRSTATTEESHEPGTRLPDLAPYPRLQIEDFIFHLGNRIVFFLILNNATSTRIRLAFLHSVELLGQKVLVFEVLVS